jgi:hypothetical protein
MAETRDSTSHLNSVCDLILISGEIEFAAPFVGVSTQVDVMQDFMESDMIPAMTGEEEITQAPELWEAQELNAADATADMDSQLEDLAEGDRGLDDDTFNREELSLMIAQLERDAIQLPSNEQSRIAPLVIAGVVGVGKILLDWGPELWKGAKTAYKWVGKKVLRGRARKAALERLRRGMTSLPKNFKTAEGRARMLQQASDAFDATSSAAVLMSQKMGDSMAQVTSMLNVAMQVKDAASFLQAFAPNLAVLQSEYIELNDSVKMAKLEALGSKVETSFPVIEKKSEDAQQAFTEAVTKDAASRATPNTGETDTPKPPTTAEPPSKKCIAVPNLAQFTMNDSLRWAVRALTMIEKELKVLNLNLAMDKDKVPGFLADKKDTIFTQDIGIGETLFKALNTIGKKESATGVMGPTEILSLAEQFKQAFPVIEVIDAITKKKSTVSVFELIMKAQDAKVVELGPGFLKWYTELDVFQHTTGAVTETPKVGN